MIRRGRKSKQAASNEIQKTSMNEKYLKRNSKKNNDPIKETINSKHEKMIEYFEVLQKSLPKLKKQLKKLNLDLSKLNKQSQEQNPQKVAEIINMTEQINNLEIQIQKIENREEENNYFLETGKILYDYSIINNTNESDINDSELFLDYSTNLKLTRNPDSLKNKKKKKKNTKSILDYTEYSVVSKHNSHISNEYFNIIDPSNPHYYNVESDTSYFFCNDCSGTVRIFDCNEGILICPSCGDIKDYQLDDMSSCSYKELETVDRSKKCYYDRSTFFKEWIARVQGKENTQIPEIIYTKIIYELKKRRISDYSKINEKIVRDILKDIGESKFFDHTYNIVNHLNGIPLVKFNPDQEEQLYNLFNRIQGPYEESKPENRKNFLSYPYTIYKLCELLELDSALPCFRLLKSDAKLKEQDEIWKKMCKILNWKFYPTSNDIVFIQ